DPAFVSKIRSFYDGVKQLLAESLAEGQRLGIVAPGETTLFATFTVGALKELLTQNVEGETPIAREEIVESLFVFLQGGYLRTGGGGGSRDTGGGHGTSEGAPSMGPTCIACIDPLGIGAIGGGAKPGEESAAADGYSGTKLGAPTTGGYCAIIAGAVSCEEL